MKVAFKGEGILSILTCEITIKCFDNGSGYSRVIASLPKQQKKSLVDREYKDLMAVESEIRLAV